MRTIIPASSGYSLLTYLGDSHFPDYSKELIIAWAIGLGPSPVPGDDWCINVTPITSKGEPEKDCFNWAVLHPDGTVNRDNIFIFKNFDHWRE